jgi:hypothetical protein
MKKAVLITGIFWLVAGSATAMEPGSIYDKHGGPSIFVPNQFTAPPGPTFCKEKHGMHPNKAILEACEKGVQAARQWAQEFAVPKGYNHGYLKGFAWGIHKGVKDGARSSAAVEQARTDAEAAKAYLSALKDSQRNGSNQGKKAGQGEAEGRFTSAFESGNKPNTRLKLTKVQVPTPAVLKSPYLKHFGSRPTMEAMVQEINGGAFKMPGGPNWKERELRILDYIVEGGTYKTEWRAVLDARKTWKRYDGEYERYYKGLSEKAPAGPDGILKYNLKDVFSDAFRKAWRVYAPYYYGATFYAALGHWIREPRAATATVPKSVSAPDTIRSSRSTSPRSTRPRCPRPSRRPTSRPTRVPSTTWWSTTPRTPS